VALPCNLSDGEAVNALVGTASEAMGRVDILVNNAGLTRDNIFMRMSDEEWDQVLAVNLSASMKLCRAAIRPMMKARWGRIINVTSIVGVTGNPGQTANCVAPGFIATPMTDALNEEQRAAILSRIPAGEMGAVDDIAQSVLFLAGQTGRYITGQTLHVNGGMAMV